MHIFYIGKYNNKLYLFWIIGLIGLDLITSNNNNKFKMRFYSDKK